MRIAAIDIGTVTARLAVVEQLGAEPPQLLVKLSNICNMGEGVAKTSKLDPAAIDRVRACVEDYVAQARNYKAETIACTLTSAARDASNSDELLDALKQAGVAPTVIPGTLEGRLALLGVAQDFPDQEIAVIDSGGGSTEFSKGCLDTHNHELSVADVISVQVGARRLTELFLSEEAPDPEAISRARDFCDQAFRGAVDTLRKYLPRAQVPVLVGGSATSLVAMREALDPYDSRRVHLSTLTRRDIEKQIKRLAGMTVVERAQIKGLQTKRAPVILGGSLAISEALFCGGFESARVSERDLLWGLSLVCLDEAQGKPEPLKWAPTLQSL